MSWTLCCLTHSLSLCQRLAYLGRLGDVVSFSALPKEVQTVAIAMHFGAVEKRWRSDGKVACGSPGEVANRPELGDQFRWNV